MLSASIPGIVRLLLCRHPVVSARQSLSLTVGEYQRSVNEYGTKSEELIESHVAADYTLG
jgi:hypothetical protein